MNSKRLSIKPRYLLFVLFFLSIPFATAAPDFPRLTGRVVDNANMLSAGVETQLTRSLEGHENATTNQVVVATFKDIQGYDIESFGYQLGRFWEIGQQGKDNGVLLVVAEAERKVRIEVGYGLEGELTDAIASDIVQNVILPNFKRGQFSSGVEAGTASIIQALGGQYTVASNSRTTNSKKMPFGFILLFALFMIVRLLSGGLGGGLGGGHYGGGYGRRSGGFGGGGGFSGGGGGFGGGGASGGW